MNILKDKKIVLVLASQGYQSIEYLKTRQELEKAGIKIIIASDKIGAAIADDNTATPVDILLADIDVTRYDGIFFIGGSGAMNCLDNSVSYHLISQARKNYIPYGAICISPRILAKSGGLIGKKATGWDGDLALKTILTINKATYISDALVVTDGLVVTATGPEAATEFAQGIIRVLTKKDLYTEE